MWLILNGIALTAGLGFLIVLIRTPTEAVRVRNALLFEPGTESDFRWTPSQVPPGFRLETLPPSAEFVETLSALNIGAATSDWDKALAIASHLSERASDKGSIRADLHTTYRAIREGHGYCADFAKVFLGLAHAAGLTARQWSFSFDGFGGHGHVVSEIYDRQRGKWVFLDVYNNFHALDSLTGTPLGALEFREAVLGTRERPLIRPNGPGRRGYADEEKAYEYYRRGADEWYLLWGNDVFSYEANPLVVATSGLSRSVGQAVAVVAGVHPRIRILPTEANAQRVRNVEALGRRVRWLLILLAVVLVALALNMAWR